MSIINLHNKIHEVGNSMNSINLEYAEITKYFDERKYRISHIKFYYSRIGFLVSIQYIFKEKNKEDSYISPKNLTYFGPEPYNDNDINVNSDLVEEITLSLEEDEQIYQINGFFDEKKNYISNVLNIPLDKIHITNIINNTLTLNITIYLSLNSILEDSIINKIEDENIVSIKVKPLLEYYIISEDNFDLRGNRTIENFEDGIRGPENNLQKYISPKNYFGLGLKVKNNFYDINNEWYIAYYNSLYIPYNYNKEHLNCNHLSSEKFHFCDYGIFLNQNCEKIENENCVIEYKGNTYFYNFMCIVNPEFVRISDENFNECYWVVSSDFDNNIERNYTEEIRPSKIILRMK